MRLGYLKLKSAVTFFCLLQVDVALVNASVHALLQQASSRSIHASYTPLYVHASYTPRVRGAYTPLTHLSVYALQQQASFEFAPHTH